ncbi:MAG: hypothetical protein HOO96_10150 [Polyangiaceae bacterium]|nr:hypothetical protein [Polyangiaceae bacterium]
MGRTLLVGDVHGCRDELDALLDRAAFTSGDHLVLVGDVLARGPDSLGVLDIVRRTGASMVRGNHEDKLLGWADAPPLRKPALGPVHGPLAATLRESDWHALRTAPLALDLDAHDLTVVHAGVVPGIAMSAQKPATLMAIRTVKAEGKDRQRADVLWGSVYQGPRHLVFGHHAMARLQLHRYATGLDTGCVYGGALTGLLLEAGQAVPANVSDRRTLLVSAPARRAYYVPAHTPA